MAKIFSNYLRTRGICLRSFEKSNILLRREMSYIRKKNCIKICIKNFFELYKKTWMDLRVESLIGINLKIKLTTRWDWILVCRNVIWFFWITLYKDETFSKEELFFCLRNDSLNILFHAVCFQEFFFLTL